MRQNFLPLALFFVIPAASAGTLGPIINSQYGTNGTAHVSIDAGGDNNDFPESAIVLTDGSLVVAGQSDVAKGGSFDGDLHQASLAKFRPNGSPDTTFGPLHNGHVVLSIVPLGGDGTINSVSRTSEGQFLVVGTYATSSTSLSLYVFIARLNGDGSLDTTFNSTGYRIFSGSFFLPSVQAAGGERVTQLVGGDILCLFVASTSTASYSIVAKLDSTGAFDASFGGGTGYVSYTSDTPSTPLLVASDMAALSSGKILLAGGANHGNDATNLDFFAMQLNPDGSIDTSFGTSGKTYVAFDEGGSLEDYATAIALDSANRIVLAGVYQATTSNQWGVTRLTSTGQLDASFGELGRASITFDTNYTDNRPNAVTSRQDGRILVGGSVSGSVQFGTENANFGGVVPAAVLLTANGSIDTGFGDSGRFIPINAMTTTSDAIVDPTLIVTAGDSIFFPGFGFKANDADVDFAVLGATISVFRDSFGD